MNLATSAESGIDAVRGTRIVPEPARFLSLRQSAALEFDAAVRLLAERARFLTAAAAVAVALEREGQFVYCATAGSRALEIGATSDVTRELPAALSIEPASRESTFTVAVPILKDEAVIGFIELAPGASAFDEADVEAVTRLSAMISTALDHRHAAEHSDQLISQASLQPPQPAAGPVLWHAPEADASEPSPAGPAPASTPANFRTCSACGFPVSGVRTVCLDCEHLRDDPKDAKPHSTSPPEMFALENQESWIEAHGYTIASLLVTALAVAIIFWLR